MIARRAALFLLCLAFFTTGCHRKTATPPTSTGPRIVALSPAAAIILRDLNLAPNIVGRHDHDIALSHDLPACGDQNMPDYEAILRVKPTHIVIQWGKRDLPARLTELAATNNWKVIRTDPLTLDDIIADTASLETTFKDAIKDNNSKAGGTAPASLIPQMVRAWTRRDKLFSGRVLLLQSTTPPTAFGPGSCHYQVLERIGGTPAITQGNTFIRLDAEDVLKLAPDAIVLVIPQAAGAPRTSDPKTLLGAVAALDIPAIRNNRIALIDDPLALTPSSAMIGFADHLAEILAKWHD